VYFTLIGAHESIRCVMSRNCMKVLHVGSAGLEGRNERIRRDGPSCTSSMGVSAQQCTKQVV